MAMCPWGRPSGYPNWMDWDDTDSPSRIFDQYFGSVMPHGGGHRRHHHFPRGLGIPYWMQRAVASGPESGMSEVVSDKDKFLVNLDVSHFSPEEIRVKTVDNQLVIEGKHEERPDEHGYITRHFVRKYVLPKNVDPSTVVSSLSHEGTLTVQAPKKAIEAPGERAVPIQMVDQKPAVEGKK